MSRVATLGLATSLLLSLLVGCPGITLPDSSLDDPNSATSGSDEQNPPVGADPPAGSGGRSTPPDKSMDGAWRFSSEDAERTVCVTIVDGAVIEIDAGCDGSAEGRPFDATVRIQGEHVELIWYHHSDTYHYWRDALVVDRVEDGRYAGTTMSVLVNRARNRGVRVARGSDAVLERVE